MVPLINDSYNQGYDGSKVTTTFIKLPALEKYSWMSTKLQLETRVDSFSMRYSFVQLVAQLSMILLSR